MAGRKGPLTACCYTLKINFIKIKSTFRALHKE